MQKHLDIISPAISGTHKQKISKKRKIITSVIAVIVIIAVIAVFFLVKYFSSSAVYIQSDKYQAVFMTNNQVYFGKLQKLGDSSYRIRDVFYIKTGASTASGSTAQATPTATDANSQDKPQLVKLGSEIHAPTDEIIIPPQNMLFWENLKSDGTVSKSIAEYKKSNQ